MYLLAWLLDAGQTICRDIDKLKGQLIAIVGLFLLAVAAGFNSSSASYALIFLTTVVGALAFISGVTIATGVLSEEA